MNDAFIERWTDQLRRADEELTAARARYESNGGRHEAGAVCAVANDDRGDVYWVVLAVHARRPFVEIAAADSSLDAGAGDVALPRTELGPMVVHSRLRKWVPSSALGKPLGHLSPTEVALVRDDEAIRRADVRDAAASSEVGRDADYRKRMRRLRRSMHALPTALVALPAPPRGRAADLGDVTLAGNDDPRSAVGHHSALAANEAEAAAWNDARLRATEDVPYFEVTEGITGKLLIARYDDGVDVLWYPPDPGDQAPPRSRLGASAPRELTWHRLEHDRGWMIERLAWTDDVLVLLVAEATVLVPRE